VQTLSAQSENNSHKALINGDLREIVQTTSAQSENIAGKKLTKSELKKKNAKPFALETRTATMDTRRNETI